jgi:prepilin-type N-terminal cleavage/methylation domain-containing protein
MMKFEPNSKFQIRSESRAPTGRGVDAGPLHSRNTHLSRRSQTKAEHATPNTQPARFHASRFTLHAPHSSRFSAAFSLIEVMIALLILGIAVVGFVQATTTAVSSSKESEIQTTAALLAQGRIEKIQADGDLEDGDSDGDWGDDFPNYAWEQTISPSDVRGLHEIQVTIENPHTGKQLYELRTMLFEVPPATEEDTSSKSKQKKRGQTQ